jgi:hypothetical protein
MKGKYMQAKSWDLMVVWLMTNPQKTKPYDMTNMVETVLLKNYSVVAKKQHFAKNLLTDSGIPV